MDEDQNVHKVTEQSDAGQETTNNTRKPPQQEAALTRPARETQVESLIRTLRRTDIGDKQIDFLPNCEVLLQERDAKFVKLGEGVLLPKIPSRFCQGYYMVPNLKSDCLQRVYVSKGHNQELLLVAYSHETRLPKSNLERILKKVGHLNSEETRATWIVIEQHESVYFFVEMTLYPVPAEQVNSNLVLEAYQLLNKIYRGNAKLFSDNPRVLAEVMKALVEEFIKVKKLNILKKQQDADGTYRFAIGVGNVHTGFYLEMKAREIITFQVYLTYNSAMLMVAQEDLPVFERLICGLNAQVLAGGPQYALCPKCVMLVLEMHPEDTQTVNEIRQHLGSYYKRIIHSYRQTAPVLFKLLEDTASGTFAEKPFEEIEYIARLNPQLKLLDYFHREDLFNTDVEALRILKEAPSLQTYTLPIEYTVYEKEKKITMNFDPSLIRLSDCLRRAPSLREQLIARVRDLQDVLLPLKTFPTPNMLYCHPKTFALLLVPGEGLHHDTDRFLTEFLSFIS